MKKFELAQYSGLIRKSDLSREMTMRNANAHRRLEGQLKNLDGQLRQRLVSVQSDIVDLKLSSCSGGTYRKTSPATVRRSQGQSSSGTPDSNASGLKIKHGPNTRKLPRQLPSINIQSNTDGDSGSLSQTHQSPPNSSSSPGKESQVTTQSFYSLHGQSRPSTSLDSRRDDSLEGKKNNCRNSLSVSTNLYRPNSSPDLRSCSDLDGRASPSFRRRKLPPIERRGSVHKVQPHYNSHSNLSERVKDFIKRPNTSSGERESIFTDGSQLSSSKYAVNEETPALLADCNDKESMTEHKDEENQRKSSDETDEASRDKEKSFTLSDDDLFLNSNLLKAYSDAPLSSASMPDLTSLGFMDYNEVIDKRLRDLQEWQHNPPTEEEMKKIKYLRLRNQPQTPDILSVFDKE